MERGYRCRKKGESGTSGGRKGGQEKDGSRERKGYKENRKKGQEGEQKKWKKGGKEGKRRWENMV